MIDILLGSLDNRARLDEWRMVFPYPAGPREGLVFKAPRVALEPTEPTVPCVVLLSRRRKAAGA